ncbi:hypothetical protein B0H10DRAFT_2216578 [Mycena sp. CBHHK59/15]|nr:hypothetical protein B0H10DRAFT_2216578 [Mycena sp. CBHHK59/15]
MAIAGRSTPSALPVHPGSFELELVSGDTQLDVSCGCTPIIRPNVRAAATPRRVQPNPPLWGLKSVDMTRVEISPRRRSATWACANQTGNTARFCASLALGWCSGRSLAYVRPSFVGISGLLQEQRRPSAR